MLYGEQRFSEAAERWGRAALLQHAPSHAHLPDMLMDGRAGMAKDVNRAFKLAEAGAALGCAHSKGALGRCYVWGIGAVTGFWSCTVKFQPLASQFSAVSLHDFSEEFYFFHRLPLPARALFE